MSQIKKGAIRDSLAHKASIPLGQRLSREVALPCPFRRGRLEPGSGWGILVAD
ncbi:hypothetical protein Q7I30_09830 [Aeromonas veronii]|uniref:hypothetical protein n=1 Tax=Aeromonas TaxID=642 RepID=UPI001601E395|nr:hypothetical protein [Aeromonas veronii]